MFQSEAEMAEWGTSQVEKIQKRSRNMITTYVTVCYLIFVHLDNRKKSSNFNGDAHKITVESCQAYSPRVLINESIILKMNTMVVAVNSIQFCISACG